MSLAKTVVDAHSRIERAHNASSLLRFTHPRRGDLVFYVCDRGYRYELVAAAKARPDKVLAAARTVVDLLPSAIKVSKRLQAIGYYEVLAPSK